MLLALFPQTPVRGAHVYLANKWVCCLLRPLSQKNSRTHTVSSQNNTHTKIKMSALKELTYQDVAEHNTKKDLYCVIHDKIYDITKFVDEHP